MSTLPQNTSDTAQPHSTAGLVSEKTRDLDLAAALRHFEFTADSLGSRRPSTEEMTKMVCQLAALTRELFPGRWNVETQVDPEIRDDVCMLFQAEASGSVEEILAVHNQWHLRLLSIAPNWPGLFRLSIDAR